MEKKFKIDFTESNVQDSVVYILVAEFNLKPNILKAQIEGDGTGVMLLSIEGDGDNIAKAQKRFADLGLSVRELENHITRDHDKCFSCGACVSICPTKSFSYDSVTWEVHVDTDKCIACGACVNACSVRALSLIL